MERCIKYIAIDDDCSVVFDGVWRSIIDQYGVDTFFRMNTLTRIGFFYDGRKRYLSDSVYVFRDDARYYYKVF